MKPAQPICDALLQALQAQYAGQPRVMVQDEMMVGYGVGIADVVLIRPRVLHGFEIKSAADNLTRLEARQIAYYGRVFDYVTLVTAPKHLDKAGTRVPEWWGLQQADAGDGAMCLTEIRPPARNPLPDARALEPLLWKTDMLELLQRHGVAHKRYHSKRVLWEMLIAGMSAGYLHDEIIESLFRRNERREWLVRWRSDGDYCRKQ